MELLHSTGTPTIGAHSSAPWGCLSEVTKSLQYSHFPETFDLFPSTEP